MNSVVVDHVLNGQAKVNETFHPVLAVAFNVSLDADGVICYFVQHLPVRVSKPLVVFEEIIGVIGSAEELALESLSKRRSEIAKCLWTNAVELS